jgi:hypothetical protein
MGPGNCGKDGTMAKMYLCAIGALLATLAVAVAANSTSQAKPVADSGIYTGTAGGYGLTFFVAPSGRTLVNVSAPYSALACTPGGAAIADTTFTIPKITIRPKGSFSAKGSQTGYSSGYEAKFSYSFSGRFTRATKQHTGTAAGTFREDIRYTDRTGAHLTCTTNSKSWTANRTGPSPKPLVALGSYKGTAAGYGLTFAAAPSRVNTISIPYTALGCSPGGGAVADTTFAIPQVAVRPDGSFSAKAAQTGVFAGVTANFSYLFTGSFQGPDSNRVGSTAGTFREDITYTDAQGVHQTCTTDTKAWAATRAA